MDEPTAGRNQQFFHGTDQRFKPGETLAPTSQTYGRSYPDKSYSPGIYMTTNHARARKWAIDVAKNRGSGVGHVYQVEPQGPVTTNQLPFGEGKEHITPTAVVKSHVSATEVLNPGYEDTGFGAAPGKAGKTYKGKRLAEFLGGGNVTPGEAKPQAPKQLKGQLALFGPGKVVDSAPQVNRRLHERDKRSGVAQPSIWDERNAENDKVATTRESVRQAKSTELATKVRTAMTAIADHDDEMDAIRRPNRSWARR